MKKHTDIEGLVRDTAGRKHRAALARASGRVADAEDPRAVFVEGCARVADALAEDGFRFAPSGPHASRVVDGFTHRVSFQSSHNNVAAEYVALSIHANVGSRRLKAWRRERNPNVASDALAGGQVGNLEPEPGWREWDLADPGPRDAQIADAVRVVRDVALPFFAQFTRSADPLAALRRGDLVGLSSLAAIEFALAHSAPDVAQAVLERFFRARPDLLGREALALHRRRGLPDTWQAGYAVDLAKATLLYGLTPPA